MSDLEERAKAILTCRIGLDTKAVIRDQMAEIGRLQKQCEGMAQSALNNGQGLLIFERALQQIAALSDSEAGEPLDDAIKIATDALAFKAPELKLGAVQQSTTEPK